MNKEPRYRWRIKWTETITTVVVLVNGVEDLSQRGRVRTEDKEILLRREYKSPEAANAARRDLKLDQRYDHPTVQFVLEPM